ncbi:MULTISPECIES: poly(glycerol-phosphate) alpha-glucosyltransferase [Staphylococcus]|uniref:poly(glycerol-phosphate) alpha-glucosyltransferase n=1 Tax=Staphylococcus TaxID=1279 RepID=UPI000D1D295D|nr:MULTISPECIES: poly(glycerol-phosphate) alpha-glucosyltransferase [Staphylococcus]AXV43142.1 hypothetical protein Ssp1_21320 [Staphylococcus sp. M0911]PTI22285.1 poly(glycerol-phosphate) alpha-glucosyltransferase [Staphylococcus warneri]RIM96702.1 poly(glycerol-phosphate) alpha-glucosyltransferase [Staphylococcus warneri]
MDIERKIRKLVEFINDKENIEGYAFVSLGKPNVKAQVKLLKKTTYLEREINKLCQKYKKKAAVYPTWIKVDIVTHFDNVPFNELKNDLITTRRNYIEYGIALDSNWNITFLPEEINVNAFVRPSKETKEFYLSEDNINNYMRKYTNYKRPFSEDLYKGKEVTKFYTKSYFLDDEEVYELHSKGYRKGLRKIDDLSNEIDKLIKSSTRFLDDMMEDSGRYNYGYLPHFDKKIGFYNILRHSSSTYALIEGLNYLGEPLNSTEKAINYIIDNYIYESNGNAYVFDDTKNINEIKLGQNASFIFAVCEYLKEHNNERFLEAAQKVANGILTMIDENTWDTTHVLNYPDLPVKEKFRIVYYDGEAALALMRLYQQDHNEQWLNTVKSLVDQFIAKDYWKYHDHWLGYCTNELVQINPEAKYFEFGIKNVSTHLDYIKNRETTFPTFLEMLMATYRLIQKAKQEGHEELVESLIDEQKLIDIIHIRADYQRTGFFYPELAMYFKNPARILGSFFIKHHGYRVRIDDIEHYVSGYVQYQKAFKD